MPLPRGRPARRPSSRRQALVVEAIAVDDRAVGGQAKDAVGAGCLAAAQSADFDKAEAYRRQGVGNFGVFVETRRQAHRMGKLQAEQMAFETRIGCQRRGRGRPLANPQMVRRWAVCRI